MSKLKWPLALAVSAALYACPFIRGETPAACTVQAARFHGWDAQVVSNAWVKLTIVPQLGGRLMQVEFDGHPYLFINPRFEGKYIAPEQTDGRWINYGGDKIWPMPEGNDDESHWVLESSAIDDLPYTFKVVAQGGECRVELDGPVDEKTGLQYSRQIGIGSSSPAIYFHSLMKNATAHTLQWSVQSVSQYNLASTKTPGTFNHNLWAYTETRSDSAYVDGYHVRSGMTDDPSFHVGDGLFRLHWMYFSNEAWIDSPGGWLAVADGESGYGMIERFHFDPAASYPGKATVIFYKNGPSVEFDEAGMPKIPVRNQQDEPFYMEAEVNSPLVTLAPGTSYAFDTSWFPVRVAPQILKVTEAGAVTTKLQAIAAHQQLTVEGSFSVVVPGRLQLRIYGKGGREMQRAMLDAVDPRQAVTLHREVPLGFEASRVSLHLLDAAGLDWGAIDDAEVRTEK